MSAYYKFAGCCWLLAEAESLCTKMFGAIIRFWLRTARNHFSSKAALTGAHPTMTVLFGFECPTVLFGAICGIFVFNVLLLAWRTTFVRNPRIINNGTTILVEQTRNADGWLARVRICMCSMRFFL